MQLVWALIQLASPLKLKVANLRVASVWGEARKKATRSKGLSENVGMLFIRRDRLELEKVVKEMMMDEATIDLNMFFIFMENIIVSE